jgi:hypothetical protein
MNINGLVALNLLEVLARTAALRASASRSSRSSSMQAESLSRNSLTLSYVMAGLTNLRLLFAPTLRTLSFQRRKTEKRILMTI